MATPREKYPLLASIIPESNWRHLLLLLVLGATILFTRIVPIYNKIFTDWPGAHGNYINFSADDAVYHMRFVHNTLHHYPWRVFFDPFTHFPYGSHIAFGPLFTLIIDTVALVVGWGHPTTELVNHVGAYMPPILGALCLIPLYFLARKIFNKTTAILATFILTFLPGEFLNRSALGFTDHHIAEVLFSTITCTFLIYALNTTRLSEFTLARLHHSVNRNLLFYGLLTGIFLGLFILVWQGALMFGAIILVFFITQLLIDHIHNNNTDYLVWLAVLTYVPPLIMILPYAVVVPYTLYPTSNILILLAILAIFIISYLLHLILRRSQLIKNLYSLALAAIFILITLAINKYLPQLSAAIQRGLQMLFKPTPGMLTVSEVHPTIIDYQGHLTIQLFWLNLFWSMPLAIIGLLHIAYLAYQKQKPIATFLLVWTIIIIAAACAQLRFNYYLAVNAALLGGYGIYLVLSLIDSKTEIYTQLHKCLFCAFFTILIFLIVDPMLMLLLDRTIPSGAQISREWYDSLIWLKTHTPDPQGKTTNQNFDYASGYYPLPKNLDMPYNYPKSAYGVMAWWDVGHQITYIAERIPNATPFQLGIIAKDGLSGAAPFFTSTNEIQAISNLDRVGARYVIVNTDTMSRKFSGIGVWGNDTKNWSILTAIKIKLPKKVALLKVPFDSPKFIQSMGYRLLYNDANGLQHLRLIYETTGNYNVKIRRGTISNNNINVDFPDLHFKNYHDALTNAQKLNHFWLSKDKTTFVYSAYPPTKTTKIFEKVKGAHINGVAANNTSNNAQVKLSLQLKTKYQRVFTYQQVTKIKNGRYSFIVPYPTTPMQGDGYSYDIKPMGDYQIQVNGRTVKVSVPEDAVMFGKHITTSGQ